MSFRSVIGIALLAAMSGAGAGCTPSSSSPATSQSCAGSGQELIQTRCTLCHSSSLVGASRADIPVGVDFDTEVDVRRFMEPIRKATLLDKVMPVGTPLSVCDLGILSTYLDGLASQPCSASCDGRICGNDACGGSCGECPSSQACDAAGQCIGTTCLPSCEGKACGDDGCGGICGACAGTLSCSAVGACACTPNCTGRACGDDGCGGSCGPCSGSDVCSTDGTCRCTPSCAGKVCGPDGCGGSCGACSSPSSCNVAGACVCVPNCNGRVCGPDGCGGSCGTCAARKVCNTVSGTCGATCTRDCSGRVCGDDGCGGSCGTCAASGQTCTSAGQCTCVPACQGKMCGPDGCGGSCGACSAGLACSTTGQCACTPNCAERVCGSDGCGGSCGSCASGQACGVDGRCACTPSCSGKTCGSDGCGGNCGTCASTQTCNSGQCAWSAKSYATDVFPIFQSAGCASGACHGGMRAAANLDLSTAAVGFAALVNTRTDQCSGAKIRVVPRDPAGSYLMAKLTGVGMCSGSVMPKMGGELSTAQLDVVRAWIGAGASP